MRTKIAKLWCAFVFILGVSYSPSLFGFTYETYLESWDSQWSKALTGLPPIPTGASTTYDGVVLDVAFASYNFPGLNGLQFGNASDVNTVIDYVHSQNGKAKISYGGASYADPGVSFYFITQTPGWPNNIPDLATGVAQVVNSYGFDGVDFDIEDANPSTASERQQLADQLFSFLQQVRAALPNKTISLTIPGQGWGTYWQLLAQDVAAAKTVDYINFMEYDIWVNTPAAVTYANQIKADIITYTSSVNEYPGPNYSQGWGIPASMIQLGLMPGYDDIGNFLSVSDAQTLTQFAISNGLFGVMTWDLNRDAGTDPNPSLDGASPYAYSNAIRNVMYLQGTNGIVFPQLGQSDNKAQTFLKTKKNQSKKASIALKKKKINRRIAKRRRLLFIRQLPPLHGAPYTLSPV